ncbi:MAG TPA: DUF1727 domain-containing protein [Candidatus Scatomorpha gallistercoris]|nr:DUF1727 domain-containing protein [Candidatus Scatomorpha gallistercoris]
MRLFLAILLCKLSRAALRILGRGGTALPGSLALKLCPDIVARLSRGVRTVMVTGTNGKTTTCRMIEQMLLDAKIDCMANRSGSNLERGIAADLCANASLTGRPKKRTAVIECDEAAFKRVCGEINPEVVVVTNIFRDQLDRYGEVTHTLESIRIGLESAQRATVCLDADDSLVASLAPDAPDRVRFFGIDAALGQGSEISDAPRCIVCGAEYEYDFHTFAHLGGFKCPKCGYSRTEPDVAVAGVDTLGPDGSVFEIRVDGEYYTAALSLPAAYNLYNAAAAVAAATALGVGAEGALKSLSHIESGFGRMERFELGKAKVTMVLVKNPAGCDRAIDYLAGQNFGTAVFCLNDGQADGTDVSWIWDAGFERIFAGGKAPQRLIVSGTRAEDMRLRLKYAGAGEGSVTIIRDVVELTDAIAQCEGTVCVMPTYTAMLPLRAELAERVGRKEFWK